MLTVFSPRVLDDALAVSQELDQQGHEPLVGYVIQQIGQFKLHKEKFAMQHFGTKSEMDRIWESLLSALTEQQRRNLFEKITPEDRVKGLSPEQLLGGLSPEQRDQLLELLQQEKEQRKKPKRGKKA